MSVTREITQFILSLRFTDIPERTRELAKGFLLDGLGVTLAGSTEKGSRILQAHLRAAGGKKEASILGTTLRVPAHMAALANGAAGHAMDYDDTQLATSKESVYGLLTHPTVPALSAVLPLAEAADASGRDLLVAYVGGVEVMCRIADAANPRHYQAGFHSSGTIGTFGAAAAAAKLLRLNEDATLRALGLAGSMAAGLRESFGTMTKPYHVGHAAGNGVVAARLARRGFTAAKNILEAKRGFYSAAAGGFDPEKITGKLGKPFFFEEPGISIKPYPSGSLSHPAQDLLFDLMREHRFGADDVEAMQVGSNSHVLNALIYSMPTTALEGKFSIPFCMAIGLLTGKAGIAQFKDRWVRDRRTVALMGRIKHVLDPEIERQGYHRMLTSLEIRLRDGRVIRGSSDVFRGHPARPMSREEIEAKFSECAALCLPRAKAQVATDLVWRLERVPRVRDLVRTLRAGR
ncbi:MAG: MmgE/PrpD family protein [candidate division NC10 bacterium]|nr:MmgE/PrpD family protein [candidate division NC10 bacterium]